MHSAPDIADTAATAAPALPQMPGRVERFVRHVVLHCSSTPNGQPLSRPGVPLRAGIGETPVNVLDAWHAEIGFYRPSAARNAYNWRLPAIGYHFVIDIDGTVWSGRHLDEPGMGDLPADTVDVCLVGGVGELARYTAGEWAALRLLLIALAQRLGLPLQVPDTPNERGVCGHDHADTLRRRCCHAGRATRRNCPGFDVGLYLDAGLVPPANKVLPAAPLGASR